jgi:UDP:flavonoid glycosyltransferase YjiC (YdhE family)
VDLNKLAREADAGLTYASHATTAAFLLAGKPVMMLPGHLEQFLLAKRVEELGAGLVQNPGQAPAQLVAKFHRVLNEPGFRNQAAGFADKYANFDQDAVLANIVARIGDLTDAR